MGNWVVTAGQKEFPISGIDNFPAQLIDNTDLKGKEETHKEVPK